jgi:hypothetical protein
MTSAEFRAKGLNASKPGRVRHDYKADLLSQISLAALPAPRGEFLFARPRRWRFDFCWQSQMVALEYQGGTYFADKSGHSTIKGIENDYRKFSEASIRGWTLILVTAKMVETGEALQFIERALSLR